MTKALVGAALAVAALASACAGPQFREDPRATPVVELAAVLDALKCGLATALMADGAGHAGLRNAVAQAKLDVNVVQGFDTKVGLTAGIPAAGATFTPSLDFTRSEVRSVNSSIDLDILLAAKDASICRKTKDANGRDAGFSTWIQGVVSQINSSEHGDPKATMKQYVYESNFTVKRAVTGGLGVEITPVKLTSSIGSSRDDIQKMKVTIVPVHFVKDKRGKTKKVIGGKPFFLPPVLRTDIDTLNRRGNFLLQ